MLLAVAWQTNARRMVAAVLLMLGNGVTSIVALGAMAMVVQSVASSGSVTPERTVGWRDLPLWSVLLAFVLATAVQALVGRAATLTTSRTQLAVTDALRSRAFAAVLAARWSFLLGRRRSDVVALMTSGAMRCGMALQQLGSMTVSALLTVATAVVAIVVSPALSAVAVVGVALYGWVTLRATVRPSHRLGQDLGGRHLHMHAVMSDSLNALRLVRAHDAAAGWRGRLDAAFVGVRESQLRVVGRNADVAAVSAVALAVAAAGLVLAAMAAGVAGPTVVVVLVLVARMSSSVRSVAQAAGPLAGSLPAVGDLVALIEGAEAAREVMPSESELDRGSAAAPEVELRDVTYLHPGTDNGVDGLGFVAPAGALTVLTGPSGAGKSTTADLVLGLLEPQAGEVLVDGARLTADDLVTWRRQIAYVPQESQVLPGTLRDNLTWSIGRSVDDDECWWALDQCAARFARDLPLGLETPLGDAGLRLSGGERQRVALATGLLRRPRLLVLDEATSALDEDTEAAVVAAVAKLSPEVTVLAIAHRRSMIDAADHVVVLRDGQVVA